MKKYFTLLGFVLFLISNMQSQTPELVVNRGAGGLSSASGKVFFANKDTVWMSDGTSAGTVPVKVLPPGKVHSFVEFNGKTYFNGPTSDGSYELWVTDGTESGTELVKDVNPSGSGCIYIFQAFKNKLYFLGDDGVNGQELWFTDGTTAGTAMVKDINPGIANGLEGWAHSEVFNDRLYFSADDGLNGEELWATDGSQSGTVLVKDIHPSGSSMPGTFAIVDSKLYFTAADNANGKELWVTDGTGGGTVLVKDINPGAGSTYVGSIIEYKGKLYFIVSESFGFSAPYNLWHSDGTSEGTAILEDSASGPFEYKGQLYFGKISGYSPPFFEYALWKTDGTPTGAVKVNDLAGGKSKKSPGRYIEAGGKLYFLRNYDGPGGGANYLDNDLWVTDGSNAGTQLIKHANGDAVNVFVNGTNIIEYQGSLFFTQSGNLYKIAGMPSGLYNASSNDVEVFLYPNPANSMLNVSTRETIKRISIYNALGALIQTESQNTFRIENLPSGIYHLHIQTENGVGTERFVKH